MTASAAEKLLALGDAVAPRDRAAAAEPEPVPAPARVVPEKVRQTVDLTGARHQDLARWKLETALALGRGAAEVSTQAVLAAAVDVLLDDPRVARAVRVRLERGPT